MLAESVPVEAEPGAKVRDRGVGRVSRSGIVSFALSRLGRGLLVMFVVASLTFFFIRLIPGNPVATLLSGSGVAPTPQAVRTLTAELGLNRPIMAQYASYLWGLLHANLGHSLLGNTSVMSEIGQRFPASAELIVGGTVVALVLGVPAGIMAARHAGGAWDRFIRVIVGVTISFPVFALGDICLLLFAVKLGILPAGGYVPFNVNPVANLRYLVLPAITLGTAFAGMLAKMTRVAYLEGAEQPWVVVARSKGLSERALSLRHIVRNTMTPVLSLAGAQFAVLFGSTVLVETVFTWPGLGSLLVQAIDQRNYPEVQGLVLVISLAVVVINMCVEIGYAFLDPRLRDL